MSSPAWPTAIDDPDAGWTSQTLDEMASELGMTADEVATSRADGTLGLRLIERLAVPGPNVYSQSEIVEESGLGVDGRRLWRALGFPDPDPAVPAFNDDDLQMLRLVQQLVESGIISREGALQTARVIGSAMQRIAQNTIDVMDLRVEQGERADAQLELLRLQSMLPTVPPVLEYTWRRHLQSAVRRRLAQEETDADERPRAIGFADLVGFTVLSQELDDAELSDVVERFETAAYDIVSGHGGRIVKMIGDEVMFDVPDAADGLLIGLDLIDAVSVDPLMSGARCGVAFGPALAREGDLFGPTVNLAARLVGMAYPSSIVTTADVCATLADDDRFSFKRMRPRNLKNIGRTHLVTVRRAGDVESAFDRARLRRGALGDRLTTRLADDSA